MYTVGIDVGSAAIKIVAFDGNDYKYTIEPTGWSPKSKGAEVYSRFLSDNKISSGHIKKVVATGYGGRRLDFIDEYKSEITCHGRGCHVLDPSIKGVIDIGGQDSKAMLLNGSGKVLDFTLNDKCAAGTGRFLQVTVNALGLDMDQIDALANNSKPLEIDNMCAVFAETEVLNLIVQGAKQGDILAGLLKSIALRIGSLAGKVDIEGEVAFCGGVAQSKVLTQMVEQYCNLKINKLENPQITGALGAAVIGF
ncbi:acyl-CoA dehydratase activase [Proteinivorax hydrogeniformans]|uniref:Acyl-CoA dehydratase activase n=1 Tax=Proteinivorax hydrogeniformans TaxID=1826727 RepID=A0AAU8HVP1_9FIRM